MIRPLRRASASSSSYSRIESVSGRPAAVTKTVGGPDLQGPDGDQLVVDGGVHRRDLDRRAGRARYRLVNLV